METSRTESLAREERYSWLGVRARNWAVLSGVVFLLGLIYSSYGPFPGAGTSPPIYVAALYALILVGFSVLALTGYQLLTGKSRGKST